MTVIVQVVSEPVVPTTIHERSSSLKTMYSTVMTIHRSLTPMTRMVW